jgi:hypothetical protein
MTTITQLLHKPYPLEENKIKQLKLSLFFGFIILIVLFFLHPFGNTATVVIFGKTIGAKPLYSLLGGAITAIVIFLDFRFFFMAFPNYFTEIKWTIGRELVWTFIIITSIATTNLLINFLVWNSSFSFLSWLNMIFYTALIGIVPATVSIILNQTRLLQKYKKQAFAINEQLPTVEASPIFEETQSLQEVKADSFIVVAENGKDQLSLTKNNFIAATSADNYIKIYHLNEVGILKNTMLRGTLKMVENNTSHQQFIIRCHRTAIVNLEFLTALNGTAQGYRLQLRTMTEEIPVSRSLNQELRQKISAFPHTIHPKTA